MIKLNSEILRFNNLNSEIYAVYHEAAVKLNISDSVMQILYTVCCHENECTIRDICRETGISKQTINSSLRNLERDGILYLEKRGRLKCVCLTEKGEQLVEQTAAKIIKAENSIFDRWTKEEKETYIELTRKFLEMMRTEVGNITVGGEQK